MDDLGTIRVCYLCGAHEVLIGLMCATCFQEVCEYQEEVDRGEHDEDGN